MSHERNKGKSFLAREDIQKDRERHAISFYYLRWHQISDNSFKRRFLIYLRPLSPVPKSKVLKSPAYANRLGEYICRLSVKS